MPVGFIDDVPSQPGLDLLGGMADLEKVIQAKDVRRVLVAFGPRASRSSSPPPLHRPPRRRLHVVPGSSSSASPPAAPTWSTSGASPLFQVRRAALRAGAWKAKRVVDIVVAALLLFLLAPLLACWPSPCASAARPILFRQRRIGQHGREIEVLKFRTCG